MVLYSKGLLPARTGLCKKCHYTVCSFQFLLGLKIPLTDGHHYAQTHERMITRHWGLCSLIFSFRNVYFLCSRRGDEKWRRRGQRLNITDKMKHLNFLWLPEIFSFTEPRGAKCWQAGRDSLSQLRSSMSSPLMHREPTRTDCPL